jgi:hypothetical protein
MQLTNNTRETHTLLAQDKLTKGLSEQYAPVSTELLLKPFFDNGWEVKRKRSNKKGTKEWLTLNNKNFLFDNGDEFTLDVLNSYNGLSALKIFFGIGRIVCLNGMVVGDMDHFKYVHRGNQIYQNIANDYDKIVAKLVDVKTKIERLNNTFIPPMELHNIINNIASKVFNREGEKHKIETLGVDFFDRNKLLETHRRDDLGTDAWTQLNIVQENIVRFGRLKASVRKTDKIEGTNIVTKMGKDCCEGKLSSFELNKIISDEFFKAVA